MYNIQHCTNYTLSFYTSAELEKKISDMKKAVREGQEVNTEETPSPAVTVSTDQSILFHTL